MITTTLRELLVALLVPTCKHKHPTWPIVGTGEGRRIPGHGRQKCLDCGAYRFYAIGTGHLSEWLYERATNTPTN